MKTVLAVMITGLLGVIAGSLAAQPTTVDRGRPPSRGILYEGALEVQLTTNTGPFETLGGNGRVYEGWVVLDDQRQIIPREQVRRIALGEGGRPDEFGGRPDDLPNGDANPAPADAPPRRRPFRED